MGKALERCCFSPSLRTGALQTNSHRYTHTHRHTKEKQRRDIEELEGLPAQESTKDQHRVLTGGVKDARGKSTRHREMDGRGGEGRGTTASHTHSPPSASVAQENQDCNLPPRQHVEMKQEKKEVDTGGRAAALTGTTKNSNDTKQKGMHEGESYNGCHRALA